MIDAVDRLIVEREAMDRGLPGSVLLSIAAHLFLVGAGFAVPLLFKGEPPLRVQDGFAVQLPPGGGGVPIEQAAPAKPEPQPPTTAPPAPKPEPKPSKILKPPKDEPKRGLPELDAKRGRKPPDKAPAAPARGSVPGGKGTSTDPVGIGIGPQGPGAPGGTDPFGDWYLASVQRKIWLIWIQQVRSDFNQSVSVAFTIAADGAIANVRVTRPSGNALLDLAAQRAVYSAAPFAPLPKTYESNEVTVQANFKPTS